MIGTFVLIWLIVDCLAWHRLKLNTKIGLHTTHHKGTFPNQHSPERITIELVIADAENIKGHLVTLGSSQAVPFLRGRGIELRANSIFQKRYTKNSKGAGKK